MNGTFGKAARSLAPDHKCSDDFVCTYQRHNKMRTIAGPHRDLSDRARRLLAYIGNLPRLSVLSHLADRIGGADVLVLDCRDQLFVQPVGRPQPEKLLRL